MAIGVAALIALTGCGGAEAPVSFGVEGAWARPTPAGATDGVVYLELGSDVNDALVSATVDPTIASAVELHEVAGAGGAGGHSHGAAESGGLVSMQQVDAIEVVAGTTIVFEPGGSHIMLVGLGEPLVAGTRFDLVLDFASGRSLTADVVVADNAPS